RRAPDDSARVSHRSALTTAVGLGPATSLFFQGEAGIRDPLVTGVQTCALPISILELSYPRYIAGERNAPPEDCGGIPGFYATLEIGRASCREKKENWERDATDEEERRRRRGVAGRAGQGHGEQGGNTEARRQTG